MITAIIVGIVFLFLISAIALLAIGGWVFKDEKLENAREEIKRLEYENNRLRSIIKRQNRRSNIDVANDYNKELNKDEGHS
jgi:outer membrane lipopolysaccharide assembly protein LptE/RlpB